MRTKLFAFILSLTVGFGNSFAEKVLISGIYYNLDASTMTAEVTYKSLENTSANYSSQSITIPSSVTYNNVTYNVTSIGPYAFCSCQKTRSITIPSSITKIGESAFSNCIVLTSIILPDGLNKIENGVFCACRALTKITIPNSITCIESYAFQYCSGLTSIVIPDNVLSLGNGAFADCTKLTAYVPKSTTVGNDVFRDCVEVRYYDSSIGDFIFVKENNDWKLSWYVGCDSIISLPNAIQNNTYAIGANAFSGCTSLTSVTISDSVTSIGEKAFYSCRGIISLVIGKKVTNIENCALQYCSSLSHVTWRAESCMDFTSSNTPFYSNLSSPNKFDLRTQIIEFTFDDCVQNIPAYLCAGLTNMTRISIPRNVSNIGEGAFKTCSSLTNIVVEEGNNFYDSRNGCNALIEKTSNTLLVGCKNSIIAGDISNIGKHAFGNCTDLSTINIPESVVSISDSAFYNCGRLAYVNIEGTSPAQLGRNVFLQTLSSLKIIVPCSSLYTYKISSGWSNYSSRIQGPSAKVKAVSSNSTRGKVSYPQSICDSTIQATPNYGYYFTQWSDGNTDNPRIIDPLEEITYTAEFGVNTYSIYTSSINIEWGITEGDTTAYYLDQVEISATANYGYHFVRWNDNITANPRTIKVTQDKTYQAIFAKNVYSITKNAEHGSIEGGTSAEYLDEVTLTVVPDYGYHFVKWNDGNTENPRTIYLTQDTTFTAEFAVDKSGVCGVNNELVWSYEDNSQTLTITGEGDLTENYTFGIEAPTQMKSLIISNEVTSIGDSAFYGMTTINHLTIGGNVASVGNYAFAECKNFDDITCYATTVPTIDYTTFYNVGNKQYIYLYVPADRERAYKRDTWWGQFDIQIMGASTTQATEVSVTASDNTATIVWPAVTGAATYELVIKDKDGNIICTLIFNENGQLTSIAFNAPGRNAPQQTQSAGFSFTVTGLDSGTGYDMTMTSKDSNGATLQTETISFVTNSPQAIDHLTGNPSSVTQKLIKDGQVLILRGDKTYTLTGQEIK